MFDRQKNVETALQWISKRHPQNGWQGNKLGWAGFKDNTEFLAQAPTPWTEVGTRQQATASSSRQETRKRLFMKLFKGCSSEFVKFTNIPIKIQLDNSKLGSTQQQKICWHWHVARIISSQKIYGLYARKHHIVEMRGDVTDAGQTPKEPNNCLTSFPSRLGILFKARLQLLKLWDVHKEWHQLCGFQSVFSLVWPPINGNILLWSAKIYYTTIYELQSNAM